MQIVCNGEPRECPAEATVADLLYAMELAGRPVAVERNQLVIPRAQHASVVLEEGDQVEVVTLVGGG